MDCEPWAETIALAIRDPYPYLPSPLVFKIEIEKSQKKIDPLSFRPKCPQWRNRLSCMRKKARMIRDLLNVIFQLLFLIQIML